MSLRAIKRAASLAIVVCVCAMYVRASGFEQSIGTWQTFGSLLESRQGAAATLLSTGQVLISGGQGSSGVLNSVEAFDIWTGAHSITSLNLARTGHTATALKDGRLLVTGGATARGTATATAEIYDPATAVWTTAQMSEARVHHTATLLKDGRVLVAGGDSGGDASVPSITAEVFDPTLNQFFLAGVLTTHRTGHAAAVLPDGVVLIAGGFDGHQVLSTTELLDPATGLAVAGPSMSAARMAFTATDLLNGDVLVAGGTDGTSDLASAERYVNALSQFQVVGGLNGGRHGHAALRLPDNNGVLVAGGTASGQPLQGAELFLPASKFFVQTGSTVALHPGGLLTESGLSGWALLSAGQSTSSVERYSYATVQTDNTDYAPGSTVVITGSGWIPGETVTLTLVESPDLDNPPPMTAVADQYGNIYNADFSPDARDLNVRFYLTARGGQSEAMNTFTDSLTVISATVDGGTSVTLAASGTATANVTVTTSGSVWHSTGWRVAASSGNLTCVNTADHNSNGTFAEAFTITAPASAGTYNVYFEAYTDAACSSNNSPTFTLTGGVIVNTAAPVVTGVTSSTADGTYGVGVVIPIQVTFNKPVVVVGTPQLTLETGTTDAVVNYSSGTGTTTLTFTYTVAAGQANADLDYQSTTALALNGGTIKDTAGTAATLTLVSPGAATSLGANKAIVIETTPPTVTNVTSSTADGTYGTGSVISVQATFSEVVNVTGTPRLTLATGGSGTLVNYASGTGTATLTFTYTVPVGDLSADLDYLATTSLALNGGTIKDVATNNATLTLPAPGAAGSLGANKNIVIDAVGAVVTDVTSSTANGAYSIGAVIAIQVIYDDVVTVTGTPQLTLETGATNEVINYVSGSGTNTLNFTYTVVVGDTSADLNYVASTSLKLNGGTVTDSLNNAATLTLPATSNAHALKGNKDIVIDTTGPTVSDVTSTTANGTYGAGGVIAIQLTFDEAVTVAGAPQLTLETGTTDAIVNYSSGSGTTKLIFTYTVAAGHSSADLEYQSLSALALNGGTIKDAAGNNATLTLPTMGGTHSLAGNKAIVIDAVAPTVTNVTSSTANGTYAAGGVISIQVTFSKVVAVTGTPQLTLATGSNAIVSYASGTGTATLTFTYTVAAGQSAADLDYASTTALALNGGTIKDTIANSPNNATLTLAAPGAAGSLGANKDLVVDAVAPTVTNVTSSTANGTFGVGGVISIQATFSKAVTVTGAPQLTLETGANDAVVNYASGTGTTSLTFTYTVSAGESSSDLDYQSTTALALNGGTIKDSIGNNAMLTLAAPGAAGSLGANKDLVVFAIVPTVTGVSSSTADGSYGIGASIPVQVTFSQAVTVTGTPQLTLATGGSTAVNYTSGSGSTVLTFTYTVAAGDSSADLNYASTSALALNGGGIKSAGGADAALTLPGLVAAGSLATNKALVIDGLRPTVTNVTSSTANGTYAAGSAISIQATFSEAVTVVGTPQLTLATGGSTAVNYASGSGTTSLTFTYTIGAGENSADLDYASTAALAANGGTIRDAVGNDATLTLASPGAAGSLGANKAIVVDTLGPTVTNVTSSTANGTYGVGDAISLQVTFSETVTVVGTPHLTLATGSNAVVNYASGTGTATLIFTYTVASGQSSSDLDYASTSALALNAGTIKDSVGNNATLTLPTPGAAGSLGANKNLVVDGILPTVTNVTSSSANSTYGTGSVIPVHVTFSEVVVVTGTPHVTLATGGAGTVANYASGSGTATLTFNYTVVVNDASADLDYLATTSLSGGTIKDLAANSATLTLPAPGAAGSLGANKDIVIDAVGAVVTDVTSSTANGPYAVGAVISIQVIYDDVVTVTGTPQLTLETGATNEVVNYVSGSGTNTLNFTYTVVAGDTSADLNYVNSSSLKLNGGTITDSLNNAADLTLPATTNAHALKGNKDIVIDTTAPTVTNVTSSTANGTHGTGAAISIQMTFSEAVTVTGTPQLTLATGSSNAVVNYASGSGSTSLTFTYTVAAGESSADLNYASTSALALNGGTIRDAATNNATLTLPALAGGSSLAGNKAIVIDAVAPTVTNVTSSTANGTYVAGGVISIQVTFSKSVKVAGTPQLTLATGSSDAVVNYASGTGTATLTFTYTVASGHNSSDLDYVSTSALGLNGGTIKDTIANSPNTATLTLPSPGAAGSLGANKALVVDALAPSVSSIMLGSSTPTALSSVTWTVTFSESVSGVGTADFALASSGLAGTPAITGVSGSGTTYTVTASTGTGSGTLGLNLVDDDSIIDGAGNKLGGTGAGNGSLTGAVYTVSRTLTPQVTASSKTYDGTPSATILTRTLSGTIGAGDDVSLTGGTATFSGQNIGSSLTVTATGLSLTGLDAAKYALSTTSATTTADITVRAITVTAASASKTYDGSTASSATPTVTSGSIAGGDTAGFTEEYSTKIVGSGKTLVPSGSVTDGNSGANYSVTFVNNTSGTITAKGLAVSGVTASNKVYDRTTSATLNASGAALVGVVAGDTVTLASGSASGTFATAAVGSAKTVTIAGLALVGADAGNYTLTQPTTSADITGKVVTVSGVTASNRVYDQTTSATLSLGSAALVGVVSGDTVTLATGSASGTFATAAVGSAKTVTIAGLTIGGADVANYTLTQPATTADITARVLTSVVTVSDKTYDGTTSATVATLDVQGTIAGDVVSLTSASAAFDTKDAGASKTVTVAGLSLSGADAANYQLSSSSSSTTATIAALAVMPVVTAANRVYDGSTSATLTSRTLTGAIAGDAVTLTGGSATFDTKDAGVAKTVTATGLTLSGADLGNYSLASASAATTADMTARGLGATANGAGKGYGEADPSLTYAITSGSLAGGDVLSGALTRASGEIVGAYAIGSGTLTAGANYSLGFTGATFTITTASLTVTASSTTKAFGDVDPALTYRVTSGALAPGDALSGSLARVSGESVGTYQILQGSLSAGGNYALTFAGADLAIVARPITVTLNSATKVYADSDPALTYQVTSGSLLAGDSLTGSPVRTAGEAIGSYAISPGTIQAPPHYAVTFVTGSLSVAPRPVTVAADHKVKPFGSADPALTYRITGGSLAPGDQLSGVISRAPGESVGTYAIQRGSLTAGANYALAFESSSLDVSPLALTVRAVPSHKTYGDADPELTFVVTGGSASTLTGALSRATGEHVGPYAIGQGTLTGGGNVAITFVSAELTIAPQPMTVAADHQTKIEGASDPALTYKVVDGSLVEGDSFTGSLAREPGEDAGAHTILIGTLTAGPDYALSFVGESLTIAPAQSSQSPVPSPSTGLAPTGGSVGSGLGSMSTQPSSTKVPAPKAADTATGVQESGDSAVLKASVFPDPATKVYGSPDPALTGSLVGFMPGDNVTAVYHRAPGQQAGTYLITATLRPGAVLGTYDVTYGTAPFTILKADPVVAALGNLCRVGAGACAGRGSASGVTGDPLGAALSYRGVGSTTYGPSSLAPTEAGRYEMTVSTMGDANHHAGTATASIAIVEPRPSGDVFYTGVRQWFTTDAATSVEVTLAATVIAGKGDVNSARVTFVSAVFPAGIPGCVNVRVTATSASAGVASCRWKATVPAGESVIDATIKAVLGGSCGPSEDTAVVTISRPSSLPPPAGRR